MKAISWNTRPTRAIVMLAGLATIAIILSSAFWLWDLRVRELAHVRLEAEGVTRLFVETTRQSLESTEVLLTSVQERLESSYGSKLPLNSMPVHLLLNTRIFGVRHLNALFLVDDKGWAVNTSREIPASPVSRADRQYYQSFARDNHAGLFISTPVRSAVDQSWTLHLARKVSNPDGSLRGVIVAAINLPHFEQLYSLLTLDYDRPVALYMTDGTLVASRPTRDDMVAKKDPDLSAAIAAHSPKKDEVYFGQRTTAEGERATFTLEQVPGFPFIVSVTNEEAEALSSWRATAIPIILGAALVVFFIIVVAVVLSMELTQEERLSRALHEANERYHQTVDSVMDAIVAINESQAIILFNPAAERMFLYKAAEVLGKPLTALIPERMHASHDKHVDKFTFQEGGFRTMGPQLEIMGRRADGTEFPIESTISHTFIGGKHQLTAVLRDVTDRRRAEHELREMNQQLRGLSASLQDVREQERARIAHELHDELGQQLTGLKLDLSWLSTRTKEGRAVTPDKVDEMRHMLDAAIASVRRLSTELRPLILDDLGFGAAVAWQTREFAKRTGLEIALNLRAESLVTDNALATALFRIVQESLTNIVRHAYATRVEIALLTDGKSLRLTVEDDGRGMENHANPDGFGLVSMRERANALGGSFHITSHPGRGTTIEVAFPLTCALLQEADA